MMRVQSTWFSCTPRSTSPPRSRGAQANEYTSRAIVGCEGRVVVREAEGNRVGYAVAYGLTVDEHRNGCRVAYHPLEVRELFVGAGGIKRG